MRTGRQPICGLVGTLGVLFMVISLAASSSEPDVNSLALLEAPAQEETGHGSPTQLSGTLAPSPAKMVGADGPVPDVQGKSETEKGPGGFMSVMATAQESMGGKLAKAQESIGKYMDRSTHRWKNTNECTKSERDWGRQHLEELKLWPPNMNWITNLDGPGEGCDHAKTIYRPLGKAPKDNLGTREFMSHWGVVYFYKDGSVRPTDMCLDVCDVNMGIDGETYQVLMAMWSIIDPLPIQQCTWKEEVGDNYTKLSTLTEQRFDCDLMWKAQTKAWQQWHPKTWSPGRNCGQLVTQQVDIYHALDKAKQV